MEKDIFESVLCPEFQTMDESLQNIFISMVRQDDILSALDFIRSLDIHFLPSKSIMHIIIFEIITINENIRCLAFASDYLNTVLNAFPPTSENREFYYDSIRGSKGYFGDLWMFFSYIVQSYFYHREIYVIDKDDNSSEPIKYPNCKFLLEYYVKLFALDLEDVQMNSFNSCLMMKLLWPSGDICLSNRTEVLFKWINDIYSNHRINDMGDLLGSMHELLGLMVKCFMQGKHNLSHYVICCNPSLAEVVEAIINFCKNAFTTHSNVKLFLALLPFKYLRAKVSEKIIRQIIKQSSKRTYVLTLRDIVDQYMFPKKLSKLRNLKPLTGKETRLRKRQLEKKIQLDKKAGKTAKLHELCRKNRFGDLLQALQLSCEDLNTTDCTGSTPLHEACQVGSSMCVKMIIEQASKASYPLDVTATNFEGLTPLHIAVKRNDTSTAGDLLRFGGSDLLTIADNVGNYPNDYSKGGEMDKLLHEYLEFTESDPALENRTKEAPRLNSFKEYSIYLHALNCLLCSYCNIFNLYDYIWKKNIAVQSHSNKICCHYIDEDVCSDDANLILEMPDLIETFIQSIKKNVSKLELNVDIELIPLRAFAASLKK